MIQFVCGTAARDTVQGAEVKVSESGDPHWVRCNNILFTND